MEATTNVVLVGAWADVTEPGANDTTWVATATNGPFEGLFGMGDTLFDARKQLAATVLLALTSGAVTTDVDAADIGAVRVLITTRKTFPVTELAGS